MTDFDDQMRGILREAKPPAAFQAWLRREALFTPADLALLAKKEEHVDQKIIQVSGATSTLAEQVSVALSTLVSMSDTQANLSHSRVCLLLIKSTRLHESKMNSLLCFGQ